MEAIKTNAINSKRLDVISGAGEELLERLEDKEWTQEDLASILGVSLKTVNQIIKNKQGISIEMAQLLGQAFETSAEFWLITEMTHKLKLQKIEAERLLNVKKKSDLYKAYPIGELIKKGWIKSQDNITVLEMSLKSILGISNDIYLSNLDLSVQANYKKSEKNDDEQPNLKVWLKIASHAATSFFKVSAYNETQLIKLKNTLNEFTILENGVELFIQALNNAGVVFMYLPHLQKTYVDGVAFCTSSGNPVIVYTARYKRIDNFWFTIGHEMEHILKHSDISKLTLHIENSQKEREANDAAETMLKSDIILKALSKNLSYLTDSKIIEVSERLNIHPAIICGILAHKGYINYSRIHRFNEDILPLIPKKFWAETYIGT
jgi:HTH-type transcriptional regulator/antitoxin HigA